MADFSPTARTRVQRLPKRGAYDSATIHSILDEAFICSVGFIVDGKPVVIPTLFGRRDNQLFIHGSAASRMLRNLQQGVDLCLEVTLVDGLVLARSAFHHSINYRSVVVFGKGSLVEDRDGKMEALRIIFEHVEPGRWDHVRLPNDQELKATSVICIPIDEASAKIRTGPPVDDEDDMPLNTWAGVVPSKLTFGTPIPDSQLAPEIQVPEMFKNYRRG